MPGPPSGGRSSWASQQRLQRRPRPGRVRAFDEDEMPNELTVNLQIELALRLLLGLVLGAIIGLEREFGRQPAGFRTHSLVALGACLFTIVSAYAFLGVGAD